MATVANMGGLYLTQSGRALSIPISAHDHDAKNVVYAYYFNGLTFEGEFVSYSYVNITRTHEEISVSALCLVFDRVTLLPTFEEIGCNNLLHVPVADINDMSKTAA